jgi:hypothetical protein
MGAQQMKKESLAPMRILLVFLLLATFLVILLFDKWLMGMQEIKWETL